MPEKIRSKPVAYPGKGNRGKPPPSNGREDGWCGRGRGKSFHLIVGRLSRGGGASGGEERSPRRPHRGGARI